MPASHLTDPVYLTFVQCAAGFWVVSLALVWLSPGMLPSPLSLFLRKLEFPAIHGVSKSRTQLSDWTELNWRVNYLLDYASNSQVHPPWRRLLHVLLMNLEFLLFSTITLLIHPESILLCSVKLILIFCQAEKLYWLLWPFHSYWNCCDFTVISSKYIKLSLFSTFSLTTDVTKFMIFLIW